MQKLFLSIFCLVLSFNAHAQNVDQEVKVRSAQQSDGTYVKVIYKADGRVMFSNCLEVKSGGEACNPIGNPNGYARTALESRVQELKIKGYARLGAKIAIPVISIIAGASFGASREVAAARKYSSGNIIGYGVGLALGGVFGTFKGAAGGAVVGLIGYVLVDQLTVDYADQAQALASSMNGLFIVMTPSIHVLIDELSRALAGM